MEGQGGIRMAMNIQSRQDISFLFSSLGSSAANVAGSNFLGEYASIKNGSYGKLMKAYYSKTGNDSAKALVKNSKNNSPVTSQETKALTKVQSTTDALKEAWRILIKNKREGKNCLRKAKAVPQEKFPCGTAVKSPRTGRRRPPCPHCRPPPAPAGAPSSGRTGSPAHLPA